MFKTSVQLVARGGTLKAMSNGKVKGQGVMFTDSAHKDLTGDYFQSDTDFKWEGKETRSVLYHHGLDSTMGTKEIGNGWTLDGKDDVALWVETQLNMRDEYEKALFGMIDNGKMGLSSGTASHMIIRNPDGKLARWPIVEISFTPTPAEPKTTVATIKSLTNVPFKSLMNSSLRAVRGLRTGTPIFAPWQTNAIKRIVIHAFVKAAEIEGVATSTSTDSTGEPTVSVENSDIDLVNEILRDNDLMDELISKVSEVAPDLSSDIIGTIIKNLLESLALTQPSDEDVEDDDNEDADIDEIAEEVELNSQVTPTQRNPGENKHSRFITANKGLPTMASNTGRPPYSFDRKTADPAVAERAAAVKSIYKMQFGELNAGVKAIAGDLYGTEERYHEARSTQLKAYTHYMRYGEKNIPANFQKSLKTVVLTPNQIKAMATQGVDVRAVKDNFSEIVDTLGGWLVPEDIRLDMVERLPATTIVRPLADVTTTSSDVMVKVKVTGGDDRYTSGVRVTWVGDAPALNQADASSTFGVVQTPIHIVKATLPVPLALLEDSAYPLTDKINEWVSNAFAMDEDTQFLIGQGIATPQGILPGALNANSLTQVTSSGGVITSDKIKEMKHKVQRQYRAGACWVMNESTITAVDQLKDNYGRYMWQDGLQADAPDTLIGFPVYMSNAMPDIGTNAFPIIFGNFKGYQIADRIGMSVVRDDITEAEQDVVKFMFRRRLGGQVAAEWMFSTLKITA